MRSSQPRSLQRVLADEGWPNGIGKAFFRRCAVGLQTLEANYPLIGPPDRRRPLRIWRLEAVLSRRIIFRRCQLRKERRSSQTPARRAKEITETVVRVSTLTNSK